MELSHAQIEESLFLLREMNKYNVFFGPIPVKKIKGVSTFLDSSVEPIAIIDTTLFGSAKEGVVMSKSGLHWYMKKVGKNYISWFEIEKIISSEAWPVAKMIQETSMFKFSQNKSLLLGSSGVGSTQFYMFLKMLLHPEHANIS